MGHQSCSDYPAGSGRYEDVDQVTLDKENDLDQWVEREETLTNPADLREMEVSRAVSKSTLLDVDGGSFLTADGFRIPIKGNEQMYYGGRFRAGIIETESPINYKYSEDILLKNVKEYIDSTYIGDSAHYAKSKLETTEKIIDRGMGLCHCLTNVMKYSDRYGTKNGFNRVDLMKIVHYAIMAIHIHDNEAENDCYIDEKEKTGD